MEAEQIEQVDRVADLDDAVSHLRMALEPIQDRLPVESILQEATELKGLLELMESEYLGSDNESERALMSYESFLDSIAMLVFFLTGDPRAAVVE